MGPLMAGGGFGGRPGAARPEVAQQAEGPLEFTHEIDLGIVQLQVQGDQVSFGNAKLSVSLHDTKAAIRIDKPADLKNFDNEDVAELELEGVDYAVELMFQPDGSWKGVFNTAPAKAKGAAGPPGRGNPRGGGGGAAPAKGIYIFLEKAEEE